MMLSDVSSGCMDERQRYGVVERLVRGRYLTGANIDATGV